MLDFWDFAAEELKTDRSNAHMLATAAAFSSSPNVSISRPLERAQERFKKYKEENGG